jgi:hypothetical protein
MTGLSAAAYELGLRSMLAWRYALPCRTANEESWVRVGVLSEACLFLLKGSFYLLFLKAIVIALTRRDLVVATGRGLAQCGPYTTCK